MLASITCIMFLGSTAGSLGWLMLGNSNAQVTLKLKMIHLDCNHSPRLVLDKEPCLHKHPIGSQDLLYVQKVRWKLLWYQSCGKHTQQSPGIHYCKEENVKCTVLEYNISKNHVTESYRCWVHIILKAELYACLPDGAKNCIDIWVSFILGPHQENILCFIKRQCQCVRGSINMCRYDTL